MWFITEEEAGAAAAGSRNAVDDCLVYCCSDIETPLDALVVAGPNIVALPPKEGSGRMLATGGVALPVVTTGSEGTKDDAGARGSCPRGDAGTT
mmetsp:Transcript_25929/g.30056  ORF Transcript_25929/g.30056 Transcript_25929/m.30056 type:complete len:94 (+) Transcript_25929:408-689(+)